MKSHRWYVKLPGGTYALGPFLFRPAVNERECRAYLRFCLGVRRLPCGTEVWPAR
jgi:hypothetical protein